MTASAFSAACFGLLIVAATAELAEKGIQVPLEEVFADQQRRDKDDTERAIAPLRPAPDAVRVDTTGLDLGEVVERCFHEASSRLKHLISGQP